MEHYLYLYRANYGLAYTVLRSPNVYGPRQYPLGEAGVVAIFTGRMLDGQQVTIYGTGEQERDFVYVGDCVTANLSALDAGSGEIFNLGWGIGTSINEIFVQLKGITGYTGEQTYGPPKLGETFKIFLDASKAQRELNWDRACLCVRAWSGPSPISWVRNPERLARSPQSQRPSQLIAG